MKKYKNIIIIVVLIVIGFFIFNKTNNFIDYEENKIEENNKRLIKLNDSINLINLELDKKISKVDSILILNINKINNLNKNIIKIKVLRFP